MSDPNSKNIEFVVLGGGYGRGEGGIIHQPDNTSSPYNDLDFFVIAKNGTSEKNLARINSLFALISKKWTNKLGMDVDFCAAKTVKYIQKRLYMQMWREMALGSIVVYGDSEDFAKTFAPGGVEIPSEEAAKLMFNRLYGLFCSNLKLQNNPTERSDFDFIARNVNKAILACGDTILMSKDAYSLKSMDKLANLNTIDLSDFPMADEMRTAYTKAIDFKKEPFVDSNLESLNQKCAKAQVLASATLTYTWKYLKSKQSRSLISILKNLKKNAGLFFHFKKLKVKAPIISNPIFPALRVVQKELEADNSKNAQDRKILEQIWKKIN